MKISIIDYGAGNIQSIQFALERLGYLANLTSETSEIINSDKVIFPGVGEASSAMEKLKNTELNSLIPLLKQPVLGICLGMQLMCKHTTEGDTTGLGIFDETVTKFSLNEKVPHMGWNTVTKLNGKLFEEIPENSYFYFVHSYFAERKWNTTALTTYGEQFSAALEKQNFFGVQFHPEKSGKWGEKLLKNFLEL